MSSDIPRAPQRRAMAGQRIPLWHKLRSGLRVYNRNRRYRAREVQTNRERFKFLAALLKLHTGKLVHEARVLEVGCGQCALMPLLFAAYGAEAHAVDVERPTYRLRPSDFLRILRENGGERALKSLARHVLFDRRFFKDLGSACGVRLLPFPRIVTYVGDAAGLYLPTSYFDMVFSFAVLEHVVGVESAVRNINAALKPDGVGYVTVHLFPSLSGGHCADWQYAMDSSYPECGIPEGIPPWDHLRESRYPSDTYLNGLVLADYRAILHEHTRVLDERLVKEGEHMLHLAPASLLEKYSREDLTTSVAMFTLKKREC